MEREQYEVKVGITVKKKPESGYSVVPFADASSERKGSLTAEEVKDFVRKLTDSARASVLDRLEALEPSPPATDDEPKEL